MENTTTVKAVTAEDLAGRSEAVRQAVEQGHLVATFDVVEVSEKASPNGKAAKRGYIRLDATSAQGMAALCGGKMKPQTAKPTTGDDTRTEEEKRAGACDFFNYGYDLDVRATERAKLMTELEGPEKAVKTAVKGLVAAGFSAEEIRTQIANAPKFKGVDGLDKMVTSALAG